LIAWSRIIFRFLFRLPLPLGPFLLQCTLQARDSSGHLQLPGVDGIEESHTRHGLGLGRLEAIVDKLRLEPMRRMVLVTSRREMLLQFVDCRAAMSVLAGSFREELSVCVRKAVCCGGSGDDPRRSRGSSGVTFWRHLICFVFFMCQVNLGAWFMRWVGVLDVWA